MAPPPAAKRLRLRRPDRCVVCGCELSAGTEAMWDPASRTVTCLACGAERAPVEAGVAGASARREYERREDHAQQKLGRLGVLLARLTGDPQSTRAWLQGSDGEVRTGGRLEKHLDGHPVRLLQDRGIPGRGQANIDQAIIAFAVPELVGTQRELDARDHRALTQTLALLWRGDVRLREHRSTGVDDVVQAGLVQRVKQLGRATPGALARGRVWREITRIHDRGAKRARAGTGPNQLELVVLQTQANLTVRYNRNDTGRVGGNFLIGRARRGRT